MFGYIKPFNPQLRICEYETYKAVYCGLCHQLGKSFGVAARITLSYDFTFLCMLKYAVGNTAPMINAGKCCVNPLKKIAICADDEVLSFGADSAIIMLYYKLLDNIQDNKILSRIAWSSLKPAVKSAYNKAEKVQPNIALIIGELMIEQNLVEFSNNSIVDAAAEPTATALAKICKTISCDISQQRILERLGYFIGRFIYLCDALDDIEEDIKTGGYNPYIIKYSLTKTSDIAVLSNVYTHAKESIYATIAEAAIAFELLQLNFFEPIIRNIIFIGLRASVDEILLKKENIS